MAEHVACIGDAHGFDAPFIRYALAGQQVADKSLRARTEQIGHGEPWSDENAAVFDELLEASFVFGAHFDVVGQDGCLSVEMEVLEIRVVLHEIKQAVDELDEEEAVLLESAVPFTVPMRSGNIMCVWHSLPFFLARDGARASSRFMQSLSWRWRRSRRRWRRRRRR